MKHFLFALSCLVLLGSVTPSAMAGPDKRLKRVLDELGYKYTVLSTDDFKLTFKTGDDGDRTQMIIINSVTDDLGNFEIRKIYSVVYREKRQPGRTDYSDYMGYNNSLKMGFLSELYDDKSGLYTILFNVQVSAEMSAEYLKDAIDVVVETADVLEEKITGQDQY